MNAALVRLFGPGVNFTSKAMVKVNDPSGTTILDAPMDFALLDSKLRVQLDLAQMKSKDMTPAALEAMKKLGLSQVVSVIRPDKQAVLISYPQKKAFVQMAYSKEDAAAAAKTPKVEKTVLAKETIDGHPCAKTKVRLTMDQAQAIEAITWNASDLKDFPVQIQTTERGNTSLILFRQIQFVRPDAKLFEAPAGFTQYNDQQELMRSALGQAKPAPAAATPQKSK
jgi:hypothetical protein